MFEVVVFEILCHWIAHGKVMRGVVDVIVNQVADNEKCAKGLYPGRGYNKAKQQIKYRHNEDGASRWHHQTCFVLGVVVVIAVEQINQPFPHLGAGGKVK